MARAATKVRTPRGPDLVEEDVDIESLVENPRNPNKHPEEQITRLMASLTTRGQIRPILARRENRMLIAGHGLRQAALRLGWTKIRVGLWNVDQATADQAMLADNRLSQLSDPDNARIAELLREIPEDEWLAVGFSDAEAEKLMLSLDEKEIPVREIATTEVHDTFWISVRGPLAQQAVVLSEIKGVMGRYTGVTVDLGTTEW